MFYGLFIDSFGFGAMNTCHDGQSANARVRIVYVCNAVLFEECNNMIHVMVHFGKMYSFKTTLATLVHEAEAFDGNMYKFMALESTSESELRQVIQIGEAIRSNRIDVLQKLVDDGLDLSKSYGYVATAMHARYWATCRWLVTQRAKIIPETEFLNSVVKYRQWGLLVDAALYGQLTMEMVTTGVPMILAAFDEYEELHRLKQSGKITGMCCSGDVLCLCLSAGHWKSADVLIHGNSIDWNVVLPKMPLVWTRDDSWEHARWLLSDGSPLDQTQRGTLMGFAYLSRRDDLLAVDESTTHELVACLVSVAKQVSIECMDPLMTLIRSRVDAMLMFAEVLIATTLRHMFADFVEQWNEAIAMVDDIPTYIHVELYRMCKKHGYMDGIWHVQEHLRRWVWSLESMERLKPLVFAILNCDWALGLRMVLSRMTREWMQIHGAALVREGVRGERLDCLRELAMHLKHHDVSVTSE